MAFAPAKEVGHGPVDPFVQPGVRSFDLAFPGFHLFLVWDVLRLHTQKQKRHIKGDKFRGKKKKKKQTK